MHWPTLDEIKLRFNSKKNNKINENIFRNKIYMLFSRTWNIDSGQTLLRFFDQETILSVCNNTYIPSKDDLLFITKENKSDLQIEIKSLLDNRYMKRIINKDMEEFINNINVSLIKNDFNDLNVKNANVKKITNYWSDNELISSVKLYFALKYCQEYCNYVHKKYIFDYYIEHELSSRNIKSIHMRISNISFILQEMNLNKLVINNSGTLPNSGSRVKKLLKIYIADYVYDNLFIKRNYKGNYKCKYVSNKIIG